MKEKYERTELVLTVFEQEDAIATSGAINRSFNLDTYEGNLIEER